jgi:hypothetical protein
LHQKLYAAVASAGLAKGQIGSMGMNNHVLAATSVPAMRTHANSNSPGRTGVNSPILNTQLQRQIVAAGMLQSGSLRWSGVTAQIRDVMLGLSPAWPETLRLKPLRN